MERWEQDRILERGDGPASWALMPEFKRYFEDLRRLAGDPGPGSSGRVLPPYEEAWEKAFFRLIQDRIEWWKQQASTVGSKDS